MSICEAVKDLCDQGRLHRLVAGGREPDRRILCVSSPILDCLDAKWDDNIPEMERWARIRARLMTFVVGDVIRVRVGRLTKRDRSDMVRLDDPSEEVWEFRYLQNKGSVRLFGRFAETNLFVATQCVARSELGGPGDPAWEEAKKQCRTDWRNLLPAYPPHSAEDFPNGYLTNAITA